MNFYYIYIFNPCLRVLLGACVVHSAPVQWHEAMSILHGGQLQVFRGGLQILPRSCGACL